jgi:PPIC-type PPIASE domain/SurA N-terminal domain
MMSLLRKHRNWLMIVIAILAVPFCLYFVKTDYSAMRSDKFATVYGRDVTIVEAQRGARMCSLARELGMLSLVRTLAFGANTENDMYAQFTLNRIVLRHEAERLGIKPTSAEIADYVRGLRPFRGPNGFDPKKFDEFTQTLLPANGFSEAQLEELAIDELCLQRIKQLVASAVTISESQSKTEYQQLYGKLFVSVVKLRGEDFAREIKISDDDIKKYYESHKAEYKTDEKRKVEYITFVLSDEQKKLTGKERIDVLQKLADRANDFNQALLEKGAEFHQVAAKFQLPVNSTGEFTVSAPDPKFKGDAQLATSAFQLTQQEPTGDAVQGPDGFYVLHLLAVNEARPLTLEEAKPKISEAIKRNRARELVLNKGAQVVRELRESLASGAPLPSALEKLNIKAEKIEPFTLADELDPTEGARTPKEKPPEYVAIKNAVVNLQPGDVSEFFPWEEGGIVAIVEKREPPDETKFAQKKASFEERILTNKRDMVFYEWLRDRQREAGVIAEKS